MLQALYNLSDDQAEYQLRDRLSFMRFLGLGLEDAVPDAKTLWLYREALAKAGAVEGLFDLFEGFLKDNGDLAMGGRSSMRRSYRLQSNTTRARRMRRSRTAGRGKTGSRSRPRTARRTRTRAGRRSMNARISVTGTISKSSARQSSCADGGERRERARQSKAKMFSMRATRLRTCGPTAPMAAMKSRKSSPSAASRAAFIAGPIAIANSEAQKAANTTRSKVRARVEHVFGDQKNGMGAELVRTIGIVRARCKIGMTNLVYNMRRFVCLEAMATAAG